MRDDDAINSVRQAISQYAGAEDALKRLVANGISREKLLWSLFNVGASTVLRPLLDQKRRRWLAGQASEIRSIKQLPQRLLSAADKIESYNRKFLAHPSERRRVPLVELVEAHSRSNCLTGRFLALPYSLRVYALFLKQLAKKTQSAQLDGREKPQLDPGRYIDQLVKEFHRPRAQHYFDDLATLITAMNHWIGVDRTVQPGALRKRYQRQAIEA